MKHNIGSYDAAARTVLGIMVILVLHHYRSWWALAGIIPVLTAMLGFCPAYCLFHFDTCAPDAVDPDHPSHSKV